jgi:hypothetical protein
VYSGAACAGAVGGCAVSNRLRRLPTGKHQQNPRQRIASNLDGTSALAVSPLLLEQLDYLGAGYAQSVSSRRLWGRGFSVALK